MAAVTWYSLPAAHAFLVSSIMRGRERFEWHPDALFKSIYYIKSLFCCVIFMHGAAIRKTESRCKSRDRCTGFCLINARRMRENVKSKDCLAIASPMRMNAYIWAAEGNKSIIWSLSHIYKTHVTAARERHTADGCGSLSRQSRTIYFRNVVKFARQTNTCTINKGLLCFCDVGVARNSQICHGNLYTSQESANFLLPYQLSVPKNCVFILQWLLLVIY